jgi:hypothetical protein
MVDDGVVLAVNGQEVYRINVGDSGYTVYVALRVTGSRQSFLSTAAAGINEHTVAHVAAAIPCRRKYFAVVSPSSHS